MPQEDVASVERELGVRLPQEYHAVLLNCSELQALKHELGGVIYPVFDDTLYLEPDDLIETNRLERTPEAATEFVFPGWWHTYFIVGSNGAGDYFCVRLDGTPGVWFLCNDSGEIERSHGSLDEYIAMRWNNIEWNSLANRMIDAPNQPLHLTGRCGIAFSGSASSGGTSGFQNARLGCAGATGVFASLPDENGQAPHPAFYFQDLAPP